MDVKDYAIFVMANIKRAKLSNIMNITDKVMEEYSAKDFIIALYDALLAQNNLNKNVIHSLNYALCSIEKRGSLNIPMILDKMIISIWKELNEQ